MILEIGLRTIHVLIQLLFCGLFETICQDSTYTILLASDGTLRGHVKSIYTWFGIDLIRDNTHGWIWILLYLYVDTLIPLQDCMSFEFPL